MSKRTRHGKSSEPDQTETASVPETAPVPTRQKRKKKERTLPAPAPPTTPCATLPSTFPITRPVRTPDQPRFPESSSLPSLPLSPPFDSVVSGERWIHTFSRCSLSVTHSLVTYEQKLRWIHGSRALVRGGPNNGKNTRWSLPRILNNLKRFELFYDTRVSFLLL
jgi:hypothetical protein